MYVSKVTWKLHSVVMQSNITHVYALMCYLYNLLNVKKVFSLIKVYTSTNSRGEFYGNTCWHLETENKNFETMHI